MPRPEPDAREPGVVAPVVGLTMATDVDGGIALLVPDGDAIVHLDGAATAVWDRLDGTKTSTAIAAAIAADDPTAPMADASAVDALAADLIAAGLARVVDGGPVPAVSRPAGPRSRVRVATVALAVVQPAAKVTIWPSPTRDTDLEVDSEHGAGLGGSAGRTR